MIGLLRAVIVAGAAATQFIGSAAPTPTGSCTVRQVDVSSYEATASWTDLFATSLEFRNGSTPLSQTQFAHAVKSGSFTVTLSTAPTSVDMIGRKIGIRAACILS
jgi:hypothetical protein